MSSISIIDLPTALLMVGMLYLLLPSITWLVLSEVRNLQMILWCVGGLIFGVSMIVFSIFGNANNAELVVFVNSFIFIGHFLKIQSLLIDFGNPWQVKGILIYLSISIGVLAFIGLVLKDELFRAEYVSFISSALLFYLAYIAFKLSVRDSSHNAKLIAIFYGFLATVILYRFVSLIWHQEGYNLLVQGLSQQLFVFGILLTSIVGHFSYVGMALDRSRRNESEVVAKLTHEEKIHHLSQQLALLDRQRSLGSLSASLSHELNQPLTAILTNAQVIQRGIVNHNFDTPEQCLSLINSLIKNVRRANKIIERIRVFVKPNSMNDYKKVDIVSVIYEVSDLLSEKIKCSEAIISFPKHNEPVYVYGDAIHFSQIILNVIQNAIEAVEKVENRYIYVTCEVLSDIVRVSVQDSGGIVSDDILAQMGTPFFTTKKQGMGVGLSISCNIAEQYGGSLIFTQSSQGINAILMLPFYFKRLGLMK